MSLTKTMLLKIKEEIEKDPEGLGYAGKTNVQIALILNSNIIKQRMVEDYYPSPINVILAGIGSSPNTVDATDIAQAKLTIKE